MNNLSVLNRKTGYFNKVRRALIKLANIIDPNGETIQNDSFYDDVSESLERIANGYSSSSSVLPPVTSEHDGKVWVVAEGEWTVGEGGDSGGDANADVLFYDYDGTIVAGYSAEDFAKLSAMPANPSHEGLVAQGWNWSLADAKEHVALHRMLDIGQMYITDDGKTRIYVYLPWEGSFCDIYFSMDEGCVVTIDWGDGTSDSYDDNDYPGSATHEFSQYGYITITISSTLQIHFEGIGESISPYIYKIELGSKLDFESEFGCLLNGLSYVKSITIPSYMTKIPPFKGAAMALRFLCVPSQVTEIGDDLGLFECEGLTAVSLPNSIVRIDCHDCFSECYNLKRLIIPDSVESIKHTDIFLECRSLEHLVLSNNCTYELDGSQSYIELGETHALKTLQTALPFRLGSAPSLREVTVLNGVDMFGFSIDGAGTYGCPPSFDVLKFTTSDPPELATNIFEEPFGFILPTTKILIPRGSLSAYQSAEFYPDPSIYTYEEY